QHVSGRPAIPPGNLRDAAGIPTTVRCVSRISGDAWGGAMGRRLMQAAVVVVVLLAAAQFIRPNRNNPPTDPSRTIQARAGTSSELAVVLDRSCRDCHSNNTVWPWYTQI